MTNPFQEGEIVEIVNGNQNPLTVFRTDGARVTVFWTADESELIQPDICWLIDYEPPLIIVYREYHFSKLRYKDSSKNKIFNG